MEPPPVAPLLPRLQQHLTAIIAGTAPPELDVLLVRAFTSQLDGMSPPPLSADVGSRTLARSHRCAG